MVRSFEGLSNYRWPGHSTILGRVRRDWQDIGAVLGYFGKGKRAIGKYEQYVNVPFLLSTSKYK